MANNPPAIVTITAPDMAGNSVAKTFSSVESIKYDFVERTINIVDDSGSFYFGYNTIATVTHVISNGTTTITIS